MTILVAAENGLRTAGDDTTELAGHRVGPFVAEHDQLWAAVDGNRIERRTEHGWSAVAKPAAGGAITSFLPIGDSLLVATEGAHLELDGGRLDSFERAPTRQEWHTPWGGPPDVRSMASAADGTIYANVHVGGILRSADRGRTWSPTIEVDADVHQVECPDPDRTELVVAACAIGLAQSLDAGRTWTVRTDGLRHTYSRAVAVAAGTLLVSASDGPRGSQSALYRTSLDDLDAPFEKCTNGVPDWIQGNVDTGWLAGTADGHAAFVTKDGLLFVSHDAGVSWARHDGSFPSPAWLAIT